MKLLLALLIVGVIAVGTTARGSEPAAGQESDPVPSGRVVDIGPGTTSTLPAAAAPGDPESDLLDVRLELVAAGFDQPVLVTAPPGDPRLFVVEKTGQIKIIEGGAVLAQPFLDLTSSVAGKGVEQGLLGLAFHPNYWWNGRFFVYYTDTRQDVRLVGFRATTFHPNRADPGSGVEYMHIPQPQAFHQAGMLQFGADGYLYIASGDGGGIGDQYDNAQQPETLLGGILRIDVDHGDPYAVPPDNPFVDGGGAPEVWAYGLRNPWRFSLDPVEGRIYIGDVGQFAIEEVSVASLEQAAGGNFGWPIYEADECFLDPECTPEGLIQPVFTYMRDIGCAVIGGYTYRGEDIPELWGHYFFGDWCGGWLRSFRYEPGVEPEVRDWTRDLGRKQWMLSMGMDSRGELYVTSWDAEAEDGLVHKLVAVRGGRHTPVITGG